MSEQLLAHRVDGQGEPLLLLNGGLMSYAAWEPLVPALAACHRLVRCDLRGQLRSPGRTPDTIEGHVPDLVALLDHLGLGRVHVVGTSFGGAVAVALAALAPARVASLAAATIGPAATPALVAHAVTLEVACRNAEAGGPTAPAMELIATGLYSPAFTASHRAELAERAGQLELLPPSWWTGAVGMLEALQRLDLAPLLPRVSCPTLVLAAGLDRLFPPGEVRALAAGIKGACFSVVPDAGHVLLHERPEELTRRCLEFLSTVVRSTQTGVAEVAPEPCSPGGSPE